MVVKMEIRHHSPSSDLFTASHAPLADTLANATGWISPLISMSPSKIISSNDSGIIIANTPSSSACIDCSELLTPGKVTASGTIPQGATTTQIQPLMLLGKVDVQQYSVEISSQGTVDLDEESKGVWSQEVHWVRSIRLAEDCHTYNVQLRFQPSYRFCPTFKDGPQHKLILQAVRRIEAGQELQLWFSEDILAMLQVVFLNPTNIQGQKKYICNRCSTLYESPNPLKLHLSLSCGRQPISALWERLVSLAKDSQTLRTVAPKTPNFEFKLTPGPPICKQKLALDLTVGGQNLASDVVNKSLYKPYTECSAFKPFKKQCIEINGNTAPAISSKLMHDLPALWPITFETDVVQLHRNLMHNQALSSAQSIYSDDAQIESLVSSLGKAKQGHICLYCGKCYSRKYGLKIHIRTHTGYKPLRCKFCDRPFGDPSNLNKHVRLHAEGNTPYKCDLCGKILVRRRDLERHLKSRHTVEMQAGHNILAGSPTPKNENFDLLSENSETNEIQPEASKPVPSNENLNSLNKATEEMRQLNEDLNVELIDIQKEELLDSNSSAIEIS